MIYSTIYWWRIGFILLIMAALAACNFRAVDPNQSALQTQVRATSLQINVEQTLVAQQSTAESLVATGRAAGQATPTGFSGATPTPQASDTPPAALETVQPSIGTQPLLETQPPAETQPPVETSGPAVLNDEQLRAKMQTANILLYEDMVARTNTTRYVKSTLERMKLSYKDDGNAQGWLTNDLEAGAPNGQPWDLIILAMEDKVQPRSDFLPLVLKTLDNSNASVILETWFLNATNQGTAKSLLERCGIMYDGDRTRIAPANMVMFPLIPDSPLFNQPNANIPLTKTINYWWDPNNAKDYDTGDTVSLAPGSQAQVIMGSKQDQTTNHGTLVRCIDDRLIWQTISSHTMTFETMTLLWENYIYNALRTRFDRTP